MSDTRQTTAPYQVVQPYGRDPAKESTLVSEHETVADAFAALDALTTQMVRTGVRPETVTLLVVDGAGAVVARPGAH